MTSAFSFSHKGVRYVVAVLALAAAYIVFAKIGFTLAFAVRQVSAVWPPSGLAVAAVFLGGSRLWPGVALGAFLANFISGETALCAAGIAVGNTAGPLVATYFLRRRNFEAALERVNDVLTLAASGALAMIVTASNGVLNLALWGIIPWNQTLSTWRTWWSGDTMGVLLFAPLLFTWFARPSRRGEGSWLELLAFAPVSLAVAGLGFLSNLRLGFLVLPLVIWSALRFNQRVTTVVVVVTSVIAILGANNAVGPFSGGTPDQRLVYLMTLMAVLSLTGLTFGALTAERELAEERRHAAERRELEQATSIARTLQAAFLPKRLPERADVIFDALYLPAGDQALVGGDWYDVFTIPDGRLVVSIGDMLGHGVGAAVAAAEIRQRIVATAFNTSDPAEILSRVNQTLEDDQIATALIAFVDPISTVLRYASAGHPTPIVAGPHIPARILPYGGIPLGVSPDAEYKTLDLVLEREALILFYTDGITEADRDIIATERALIDAVGALVQSTANQPAETLRQHVMRTQSPVDDVVLLMIRLTASPRGVEIRGASTLA